MGRGRECSLCKKVSKWIEMSHLASKVEACRLLLGAVMPGQPLAHQWGTPPMPHSDIPDTCLWMLHRGRLSGLQDGLEGRVQGGPLEGVAC